MGTGIPGRLSPPGWGDTLLVNIKINCTNLLATHALAIISEELFETYMNRQNSLIVVLIVALLERQGVRARAVSMRKVGKF